MHAFTETCGLATTTNAVSACMCDIEFQSSAFYVCYTPGPPNAPVTINTRICYDTASFVLPLQQDRHW